MFLDFGNEMESYIINKYEEVKTVIQIGKNVFIDKRTNLKKKIGKFVRMLFGETKPVNQAREVKKYLNHVLILLNLSLIVNMFKAERERNMEITIVLPRKALVSGNDIRKWYKQDNAYRYANL